LIMWRKEAKKTFNLLIPRIKRNVFVSKAFCREIFDGGTLWSGFEKSFAEIAIKEKLSRDMHGNFRVGNGRLGEWKGLREVEA
jgi:hypothetical protein